MNRFFSHYGSFASVLTLIADVAMLSAFITIASIPVVTIGPALSAGFYVLFQIVREEGARPGFTFWRRFGTDFRAALGGGIILVALLLLGAYQLQLVKYLPASPTLHLVMRAGVLIGMAVIAAVGIWFFAYTSQFSASFAQTLRNAALLAIGHLPRTLSALLFTILPLVALYLRPSLFWSAIILMPLFGFGFVLYLQALVLNAPLSALKNPDPTA
ncbi:YesL family protein [Varibaculum prostatecancerukia]|uniref:YesL family protein n=1 Tax=Varibaculum prostatecancerukia TaxID=2811781 RepID=UPI001C008252|nr:YesL family protein [Varibaculum prostatecancerukia]